MTDLIVPGRCAVVAEAGQNHDGVLQKALDLCRAAKMAGAAAIKFQKRHPSMGCIPAVQRETPKETPWGIMPYIEYRRRLELGVGDYEAIDEECRRLGLPWYASAWDVESVQFLSRFDLPAVKIPSAKLTDCALLEACRRTGRPVVLSTGMSTEREIGDAVALLDMRRLVLLWCRSTYPAEARSLNLLAIRELRRRYPCPVGFSSHHPGVWAPLAAAVLGAAMVEVHVTLDRSAPGTDHAASFEPTGLFNVVRYIRRWEEARGTGALDGPIPGELPILRKLRGP